MTEPDPPDAALALRLYTRAQTGELWALLREMINHVKPYSRWSYRPPLGWNHSDPDINWLLRNGSAHTSYEDYKVHIRFPGGKLVYNPPAYEDYRTAYHITRLFQ